MEERHTFTEWLNIIESRRQVAFVKPLLTASLPMRVQRKRTKGWKMPENTIYIGRPSKWGNEWVIKEGRTRQDCVNLYKSYLEALKPSEQEKIKTELRGKNLACWCKEGELCHGDILLAWANCS